MKVRLMKTHIKAAVAVLVMVSLALFNPVPVSAQANLRQPSVYRSSANVIGWTAGTLNNGGHAVTITAGTTALTASKTDCSAPLYASCNFVYSNSSGTVANTVTLATAAVNGNILMAYVETSGSDITKLSFPAQSGAGYTGTLTNPTSYWCGTTTTCAATLKPAPIVNFGTVAMSTGTAVVTGLTAYTSTATFSCTTGDNTAATATKVALTSSSSITITSGTSDVVNYICIGY